MQRLDVPLRVVVWQDHDRVLHFVVRNPNRTGVRINLQARRVSEIESVATIGSTGRLGFEPSAIFSWWLEVLPEPAQGSAVIGLHVGSLRLRLPLGVERESSSVLGELTAILDAATDPAIAMPLHYVEHRRLH